MQPPKRFQIRWLVPIAFQMMHYAAFKSGELLHAELTM